MFSSIPNSVGPMVELVANSASLIVIFSEKGMDSGRKTLLFMLLSIALLYSLAKFSAKLISSKSASIAQTYAGLAVNEPFIIQGAELIVASGSEAFVRSAPSQYGNLLEILPEGAMAKYEASALDNEGRVWHLGTCNGVSGWMCSIWTTLQ